MRASNEAAQALYRRFGFAPVGTRAGYYRHPLEDALVLWAHEVDAPLYALRLDEIEGGLDAPVVVEGMATPLRSPTAKHPLVANPPVTEPPVHAHPAEEEPRA